MLYICEKQFYKVHNTSLFTGLQAETHFGRPNFMDLFTQIQNDYIRAEKVVVLSCCANAMTKAIDQACEDVNSNAGPTFLHSSDSFY